jgi:hypothetical protein
MPHVASGRPGTIQPVRSALLVARGVYILLASAVVLAACGADDGLSPAISFDATTTPSATEPTATEPTSVDRTTPSDPPEAGTQADQATTPGAATEGAWLPVAGNLEGLASECGNLSSVWSDPDRDMVIVGVALQGLWANEDGSDAWTQLGQGAGSAAITNRLTSIVRDPEHPDTFWESGIYSGGGVYRTDDNGQTFQQLGDVTHSDLVSVDLNDPLRATLLTGVHEQSGLYRSTDGGETWDDLSSSLDEGIGFTTAPHIIDDDTFLLGTNNGSESGVYRTADGGLTWTRVFDAPIVGRPVVSEDGVITWLLDRGGGTIRSDDDGRTWATTSAGGAIATTATNLAELPDDVLVTIGSQNLVASEDGGLTWTAVGPALPYVPNGVTYAPLRDAYYIWRSDCSFTTDNPIAPDSIMRWDVGGSP